MSAAGAYGRRKPRPGRRALRAGRFLTGAAVAHPAAEDYIAALGGGWAMLGNDSAGDCNAVAWANTRRLVSTTLGHASYPTQAQVWEFYRTQNPDFDPAGSPDVNGPGSPADQGMDIQDGLEYLTTTGGPDGVKALAFAQVDLSNDDEVEAALAVFGSLWLGIDVLEANEAEFAAGKPWDAVRGSPVVGGHAIMGGGYGGTGAGALAGSRRFVTWATETSFTDKFWTGSADGSRLVEEAWVVIWPEHMGSAGFLAGVDLAALEADYQSLTGSPFPDVPPVPPGPTPPAPGDIDEALNAVAGPWAAQHRTRADLVRLQSAIVTWQTAKGYRP